MPESKARAVPKPAPPSADPRAVRPAQAGGGGAAAAQNDDVFISPRVIDRGAFDEFASTLKDLIARAAAEGRVLRSAASDVEAILRGLSEAGLKFQQRMDAAGKLLAGMDKRVSEAESTLGAAIRKAEHISTSEAAIQRAVEEGLARLSAQTTDVLAASIAKLSAAEEAAVSSAARQREQAEKRFAERLEKLQETADAIDRRVSDATSRAENTVAVLEQRLDAIRKQTQLLLGPGAATLTDLCNRAVMLLGRDPTVPIDAPDADPPTLGSMSDLVIRAEKLRTDVASAAQELEDLRKQSTAVRAGLGQAIMDTADLADRMRDKHTALRLSLEETVHLCDAADRVMRARATELRAAIGGVQQAPIKPE